MCCGNCTLSWFRHSRATYLVILSLVIVVVPCVSGLTEGGRRKALNASSFSFACLSRSRAAVQPSQPSHHTASLPCCAPSHAGLCLCTTVVAPSGADDPASIGFDIDPLEEYKRCSCGHHCEAPLLL